MTQAKIKTTNVFNKAFRSKTRITCLQGGTRSSKTYSLCQLFIVRCLQETGKVFTICRKTLPALKGTAYRDVLQILKELELYKEENDVLKQQMGNCDSVITNYEEALKISEEQILKLEEINKDLVESQKGRWYESPYFVGIITFLLGSQIEFK